MQKFSYMKTLYKMKLLVTKMFEKLLNFIFKTVLG